MTLVNVETGEVAEHHPTSLVAVSRQCSDIEAWAAECESVPELREASNRLSAIDQYLERTSTEGRSRVAAALRRLEVRIGELLGPADVGGDRKSDRFTRGVTDSPGALTANQRSEFRKMADRPDVVEQVIEESDDDNPASRRKVMNELAERRAQKQTPRRTSLPEAAEKAGWELRKATERLERIRSDDRFASNKDQVAAHWHGHLSYAIEVCQDLIDRPNHQSSEDS